MLGRQVGEGEALADGMAVVAGGDHTDATTVGRVHAVGAVDLGDVGVHGEVGQLPAPGLLAGLRPGPPGQERIAADEVTLVGLDEPMQAGLVGTHVVGEVAADHVLLLHAQ